jgi:hypothetical protein
LLCEISPAATGGRRGELQVEERYSAIWKEHGTGGAAEIYARISRARHTAAPQLTAEIRTIDSIKLEKRVQLEREQTIIETDSLAFADTAVREALGAIRRHNLSGAENIAISEDGILSMQWRKIAAGAAMVFTGDGKISVSIATPSKLYSQRPSRINASDPLPRDFLIAIAQP